MLSTFNLGKEYVISVLKWIFYSVVIGVVCGVAGSVFHHSVDAATHLRESYPVILLFLPLAGVVIVFIYNICKMENDKGTNSILSSARSGEKVPLRLAPLIFVGTTLTHLCGGSSGREGAALQIGGSIGSFFSRVFKAKESDAHIVVMCGMSALFSAVFGTPLTAAVFSLEVVSVGAMHYGGLLPCVLSALVAKDIATRFNLAGTHFNITSVPVIDYVVLLKVIVIAALAGLLSIVFILAMHNTAKYSAKFIKNKYLRAVCGGVLVILLTLLVRTNAYNGAGMQVITAALEEGTAPILAFALKIIFTAITLSAGFKGGEIVPTFFIGSTFGVFIAPLFGLDPSFTAAICLIALFCGVVNSPIASIVLSIEIFGMEGLMYFAVAVAVSYIISGYYSLYSSQKFVYSKLQSLYVDCDAK